MTQRSGGWVTPAGHSVVMYYRDDTSDWNTVASILTSDEYAMPRGLSGVILDVGSHIGAFAIGAAKDNPEATVIAVEALPENAELIQANSRINDARVTVYNASAGGDGRVRYGSTISDFERQHYFIGGGIWQDDPAAKIIAVDVLTLSDIVEKHGPIAFMKIDCEGCEWAFLSDPAIAQVHMIVGEHHPRHGMGPARLRELLEPTHTVTLDDALDFGPFRAVLR